MEAPPALGGLHSFALYALRRTEAVQGAEGGHPFGLYAPSGAPGGQTAKGAGPIGGAHLHSTCGAPQVQVSRSGAKA